MSKTKRRTRNKTTRSIGKAKYQHKDMVFRMYFNDPERLLALYNVMNHSNHTDLTNFSFTTLENAVYLNYKNDLSFILCHKLNLYEHQSTHNPNMPLRMLFYVSSTLQVLTENEDLYLQSMVKIPAPQFVVFYNGEQSAPARWEYRLSEQYEQQVDNPQLELVVEVVNINAGVNEALLNDCKPLWEYAQLVKRIRDNRKEGKNLDDAVRNAVDSCIEDDIMRDFLVKNKAEVIAMSIFEYDEEKHLRNVREEGRKEGRKEGREEGELLGLIRMIKKLSEKGFSETEIAELVEDEERSLVSVILKAGEEYGVQDPNQILQTVLQSKDNS